MGLSSAAGEHIPNKHRDISDSTRDEHRPAVMNSRQNTAGLANAATPDGNGGQATTLHLETPKHNEPGNAISESRAQAKEFVNGTEKKDADAILQDILETLQNSTIAGPTGKGVRAQFWAKYKKVAEDHDNEFLERYNSDMDIVLIFSGLFSAVSTAFIVAMETTLTQNPTEMTNALLIQLVQIALGDTAAAGNAPVQPLWPGPTRAQIWTQSIAYASLSTSLLAAFGAVLAKQWLGYYKSSRYGRGSLDQQSKRRQEKLDGLDDWYFDSIVQSFPVLILLSLILFGIALGTNLWFVQRTIASVIIGTTVFGFLFYACTIVMSLMSPACPFQTPISTIFRSVISMRGRPLVMIQEKTRSWRKSVTGYFGKIKSQLTSRIKIHSRTKRDVEIGSVELEDTKLLVVLPTNPTITSRSLSQLEVPSVRWLLEISTDPEVFLAAARMVPEIEWPPEVDVSATFVHLVDALMDCFDLQDQFVPGTEQMAMAYALAISHLFHEHRLSDVKHIDVSLLDVPVDSQRFVKRWAEVLRRDSRLELFPLPLWDDIMVFSPSSLDPADLPSSELVWVSHILPHIFYLHWQKMFFGTSRMEPYPDIEPVAIKVVSGLLESPSPSPQIVANCVVLVGCILGLPYHPEDLKKVDKSSVLRQIGKALVLHLHAVLRPTGPGSEERYLTSTTKKCLPLISRILQHSPPPVTKEDSEDFSSITQLYRTALADLVAELFQPIFVAPHSAGALEAVDYARAALRIAVVIGGGGQYKPDDLDVLQYGNFSLNNPSGETTKLLVEFLAYLCAETSKNTVAIGDLLLLLSGSQEPSEFMMERYLTAIAICMGADQPGRVRYAALRAASNACSVLAAVNNRERQGTPLEDSLLEKFSLELRTITIHDEPLAYMRYEHYSRLIHNLTKNTKWAKHLSKAGHTQCCVDLMSVDSDVITRTSKLYLCAGIKRMFTSSVEVAPQLWSKLLSLWGEASDNNLLDSEAKEIIPVVVELTIECIPGDYDDKKHGEDVEEALSGLQHLRHEVDGQQSEILLALDELKERLTSLPGRA